jgi:DsbC/DsbD-like thiol-disulfide interchange protein
MRIASLLIFALGCTALVSAQIGDRDPFGGEKHNQVVTLTAPVVAYVPTGKTATVELRFRVQKGLHINSHAPHDHNLIPTGVTLAPTAGVQVVDWEYPQGVDFALALQPNYKLSVYTGEFAVRLRVKVTAAGRQTIPATLRYQACDSNACMPPRNMPFTVEISAK